MATESFQIQSLNAGREGHRVLRLAGSLTVHTLFNFQSAVRAETAPALILDFTAVPYIDSAGLGALVAAYVARQKNKRALALVGLNDKVKTLLEMTHVAQMFPTYSTLEQAEAALP